MKIKCLIIMTFLFLQGVSYSSELIMFDGTEENLWQNHAVILAKISNFKQIGIHEYLDIDTIGVISTEIFIQNKLNNVQFWAGNNHAIDKFDKAKCKENTYVIFIEFKNNKWIIPDRYLKFFDSKIPLEMVDGTDDVIFLQLVDRLAKVRAKSRSTAVRGR